MDSNHNSTDRTEAERLNQHCVCVTLDQPAIIQKILDQLGDKAEEILSSTAWHQFFSNSAVFVPGHVLAQMQSMVQALEMATTLPDYQRHVLSWAPATAQFDPGPTGAFMGYDFHLGPEGPRLIEINTNAGGAFLNAILARAQRQCCSAAANEPWIERFDDTVITQFVSEWRAQRGSGCPGSIAIVDTHPEKQYLYPEFRLAQQLLKNSGIDTVILPPEQLHYESGALFGNGKQIDLVYNRLVDFGFEAAEHAALRSAWLEDATVVTPNPHTHALFADKRNLTVLSDPTALASYGLSTEHLNVLRQGIPKTVQVTAENCATLWKERRQWFFKPVAGHGSKGVYRGSKLTKNTFARMLESDYIAQAHVPPSERLILVDGERQRLKVDVRLYTYRGDVILAAARMYRGQTTNFRTPGGGFAPLLVMQD